MQAVKLKSKVHKKSKNCYRVVIALVKVHPTYRSAILTALRADDRVCLLVAQDFNDAEL